MKQNEPDYVCASISQTWLCCQPDIAGEPVALCNMMRHEDG